MVAYSFRQRFRAPILARVKHRTIRAERKRHARPGEELQLYTGMRTRQCSLIGRAVCEGVGPVRIGVEGDWIQTAVIGGTIDTATGLDAFAQADGFADWPSMRAFWRAEHPDAPVFSGVLIEWGALLP